MCCKGRLFSTHNGDFITWESGPQSSTPPTPSPPPPVQPKGNGEVVCGRLGLGGQFHLVGSSAAMPYLSAAQEVSFVPEWPRLQEKKAACSRWALGRREGELGRWWMGNPWWGGIVSGRAPLHSLLLQMLRCILIAFSLYAATGSMPNTSPLKTYSRNICFKMKILSNVQGVQKKVPSE